MPKPSIFDKSNPDGIFPVIAKMEAELNLPPSFCEVILQGDDWSLVIKLHALMEAVVTGLLSDRIGGSQKIPELHNVLARHPMRGKLSLAESLGLFTDSEGRLIRLLSALRNMLVHNISYVSFNLTDHLRTLDISKLDKFVQAVFPGIGSVSSLSRGYILRNPKLALWESSLLTLATLTATRDTFELKREVQRQQMKDTVRRRRIARALQDAIAQAQRRGDTPSLRLDGSAPVNSKSGLAALAGEAEQREAPYKETEA
jgi:hypothetical protein